MDGKINEDGELLIKRGSQYKCCECSSETIPCSDRCALFGEPETNYESVGCKTEIELCTKTLQFDDFIDERI